MELDLAPIHAAHELPGFARFVEELEGDDETTRGVFADYLEEGGSVLVPGLRAQISLGVRPHLTDHRGTRLWGYHDGRGTVGSNDGDPAPGWARLPTVWYAHLWDADDLDSLGRCPPWFLAGHRMSLELHVALVFTVLGADTRESYLSGNPE